MAYTREFLISELHRFVSKNERNPKAKDMRGDFGYPNIDSYYRLFGSFNGALTEAGLEVNQYQVRPDGSEVCCKCGAKTTPDWFYINDSRVCRSCYEGAKYRSGELDSASNVGFGFIAQRVAAKALGLSIENDCNCSRGFGAAYDLYDETEHSYINVKAATLNSRNNWVFHFVNKHVPDAYILMGFSYEKTDISHVWILRPSDDIMGNRRGITITNSDAGLNRVRGYEIDAKVYNDAYHNMSLSNCTALADNSIIKVKLMQERVNYIFASYINKSK